MNGTTTLTTTVSVYLGLNIQIVEDRGEAFLRTIQLVPLTWALMLLWQMMDFATNRIPRISLVMPHLSLAPLTVWMLSISQTVSVTLSLFQIGFKAALYGVGVPV